MFPRFCHAFTVKPFPKIKHTEIVYRVTNAVGIPGEELLFIPFRVGWVPTEITFISNVVNLQSSQNIRGRIFAGRAGRIAAGPRSRKSFHRSSDWLHATPRQIYVLLIAVFLPPCRRATLLGQYNHHDVRGRYGKLIDAWGRSITREGHLDYEPRRNFVSTYIHVYNHGTEMLAHQLHLCERGKRTKKRRAIIGLPLCRVASRRRVTERERRDMKADTWPVYTLQAY